MKNMLNNTTWKGKQCRKETKVLSLTQEAMRGDTSSSDPRTISSFNNIHWGLGWEADSYLHSPLAEAT